MFLLIYCFDTKPALVGLEIGMQASKFLVVGAVNTTINDQGRQYVAGRFQSIRMLLIKQTEWSTFVQSHPSVKTESF